jgi:uncharacterized protein|tara:strand:+ start:508 stop:756 length:249 start_codon:yes stop_codon:yes gene_type:complete
MRHTSLILVLHNNGLTGIDQPNTYSRRLKMTTQKQMTEQELDWYSTKSLESAQALIEAYEKQLCVMGKIVESLTESSVKEDF